MWIDDARVITPAQTLFGATIVVEPGGKIEYVGPNAEAPIGLTEGSQQHGGTVVPGFIDIHTHGGVGHTFGQGDDLAGELRRYSRWVASTGVTGFLCTLSAPDTEALRSLIAIYVALFAEADFPGARPLGFHLEGPYLNPEKKGAFNAAWLHPPTVREVAALLEMGEGWIRQVTLAPELPNAAMVAATLREAGVTVALGHSNTDYAAASAALRGDFSHVTHAFNAQRGFHHREPGVLGAVLTSDGVTAELIADTVHVHPGAMKVLLRCLGPDRVVLITDAMAAAGLGDGRYELVGHEVWVKDGEARQVNGTIAGSTATLDRCVRNMVTHVGMSLADAVRMASMNPAAVIKLGDRLGQIAVGCDADIAVLDAEGRVVKTLVKGRVVYDRDRGGS